ncbi:hypothetical protein ACH5RR_039126 [Cinchona calisaya]|uniref:Tf2-1-like SH3-like domain-containing protein n=1 Tax=Cinchona calisaya TaxID=153742 RepID=A0ABD2XYR2_9GENT
MKDRRQWNVLLRENLLKAQNRMKEVVDRNRIERTFEVGEFAYLKLQPYGQTLLAIRKNLKLVARCYAPYRVIRNEGTAVYELDLSPNSQIHPVFHVSMLKKSTKRANVVTTLPQVATNGQIKVAPTAILNRRTIKGNRHLRNKFSFSGLT